MIAHGVHKTSIIRKKNPLNISPQDDLGNGTSWKNQNKIFGPVLKLRPFDDIGL